LRGSEWMANELFTNLYSHLKRFSRRRMCQ